MKPRLRASIRALQFAESDSLIRPATTGYSFLKRFFDFARIEAVVVDLTRGQGFGKGISFAEFDALRLSSEETPRPRKGGQSRGPRYGLFAIHSTHFVIFRMQLDEDPERLG